MKIFAIETSCDETALSLVEASGGSKKPKFRVLQNLISSQIKVHRPFGGVVPSLAKREHIKNLPLLFRKFGRNYRISDDRQKYDIDVVAVTVGPGLEPALWAGIEFAKKVAKELNVPLIGANHMEGHMYSVLLPSTAVSTATRALTKKKFGTPYSKMQFPAVGLVVSGGHTILVKLTSFTKWQKLGETRDDAAGEAFDKVAKMLKLPYPGGPEIQKIAEKGDAKAINFPRPMINSKDYDFSFSGLKTAVLYYLRDKGLSTNLEKVRTTNKVPFAVRKGSRFDDAADVAASFQQAVIDTLVTKTIRAAREYGAKTVFLCGGVAANKPLREALQSEANERGMTFMVPEFIFNTDNAVMIAAAAYLQTLRKKKYRIWAQPNLNL